MATPLDLLRSWIANEALPQPNLAIIHSASDAEYQSFIVAHKATPWARVAGLPHAAQPWPDAGQYAAVILPLPANRETLSLCLTATCAVLAPGGTLYLFGHNDTGIKSAARALSTYFSDVELLGIGGHGRLYAARQPLQQDYALASFRQQTQLALPGGIAMLTSYPGLFAKGKLDSATAFLIEHLPTIAPHARVLDFASGIGVIAKAAQQKQPGVKITLVDHDALALAAAALNMPQAELQCVASPSQVTGTYDFILSNPPIHDGQTLSYEIVEQLLAELPRLLAPDGEAYIVAQVTVPIAKMAMQMKMAATEVAANKSFRVTKLTHQ